MIPQVFFLGPSKKYEIKIPSFCEYHQIHWDENKFFFE